MVEGGSQVSTMQDACLALAIRYSDIACVRCLYPTPHVRSQQRDRVCNLHVLISRGEAGMFSKATQCVACSRCACCVIRTLPPGRPLRSSPAGRPSHPHHAMNEISFQRSPTSAASDLNDNGRHFWAAVSLAPLPILRGY